MFKILKESFEWECGTVVFDISDGMGVFFNGVLVTCQNPDGCGNSTDRTALIAGLTSGLGTALVAAVIGILLYKRHRLIKEAQDRLTREREAILNANGGGRSAKIFSGKEIKRATNNFSRDRLLGAGGYGEVYKGFLNDGTVIAVKCAKLGNTKSTEQVLVVLSGEGMPR